MDAVLVCGGAGFIGGSFVRHFITSTDALVVVLDKLTYAGTRENLADIDSPRLYFVEGDIGNRRLVTRLLHEHHCDAVVNFAAETHVDRSIEDPDEFIQTNLVGVYELLEAALVHTRSFSEKLRERFRFLHISTDEVYGSLDDAPPCSEGAPYRPASPYAASKAGADHLVRAYERTYGLPTMVATCSNCYGPRQFPEKLLPLMLHRALGGLSLPLYGDGSNLRSWLHVDDCAQGVRLALQQGDVGETYHLGGKSEFTNLEVVTQLCDLIDASNANASKKPTRNLIEFVPDRPGHDFRYALDSVKAHTQLGWRPGIAWREGLAETVRWYLDHPSWSERAMHRAAYSGERLGLGHRRD